MDTTARIHVPPRHRPIAFAPVDVACRTVPGGDVRMAARAPLAAHNTGLGRMFRAAVEAAPDRVFLAERENGAWRTLTWAACRPLVDGIAAALLERGLSARRPVVVLSGNGIDHALITLAAHCAAVPVAPVSPAYSLQSRDLGRLRHVAALLQPGLVYVSDTAAFAAALDAITHTLGEGRCEIVAADNRAKRDGVTSLDALAATRPGAALEHAVRTASADTIAKFLFTSGSTGTPKAVINTHGMLTANQQQVAQIWPFLEGEPPVLLDWLPWNHTFGGNHNFNLVVRHAGTLHIDGGRPVPAHIGETVANLRAVSPTLYFNVPAGYAALLPHLEGDAALARQFFARLRLLFYAGAALPQDLWERLEAVAVKTTGERIAMISSWGTTETAPMTTACHFLADRSGMIGVPAPGVELKLVPRYGKLELRVRGPNVTPGYWRQPEATAAAFDDEGFYCPGDAVRFAEPGHAEQGLVFDGRLAENFKLATGTWVHSGALRTGLVDAASPALLDAVVCGENLPFLAVLGWLDLPGCRRLSGRPAATLADLAGDDTVRSHVRDAVARWNAAHPASSERIARVLLLADQPAIDANEITDKGYVNQRAARAHRHREIAAVFAAAPGPRVITL